MSPFVGWEFRIGEIVKLPNNQGKGVVVARKCIEDAEGKTFSYSVFNKATEHSVDYPSNELMSVKAMPEV